MSITYRLLKSMLQCRSKVAYNVLQIAEGGELEVQILNIAQMIIISTTLDFSTVSPLLAICCYVSVLFFIFFVLGQLNNYI